MSLSNQTYVFYHYPCNDGELAQMIWKRKYPNTVFIKWNHTTIDNNVNELLAITEISLICPS